MMEVLKTGVAVNCVGEDSIQDWREGVRDYIFDLDFNYISLTYLFGIPNRIVKQVLTYTNQKLMGYTQVLDKKVRSH